MVSLTIDGKEVVAEEGTTILKAAKSVGIDIPTLCYHERLNPIGSCRMCVVEIEGLPHPMTACNTPVVEGIKVTTASGRLLRMREETLKLILVNHPLDCPICDKGGECTLQDLVHEFEIDGAGYQAIREKRESSYATPLIHYWPDRCIMCLRCITACREIKGLGAIDISGSGFDASVVAVDKDKCESCGECISVCPTGALTENLSQYKARPWMVDRVMTTCTYCGCGCQLEINVLDNRITSITTKDHVGINKGSLCVKGRFGYEFIESEERITKPLVKKNGEFHEASWEDALNLVAENFNTIKASHGADAIACLSSARCTNEENYLIQKLMRAVIGTNNIDHCARLWHSSTVAGLATAFGSDAMTNPIADVLKSEAILVTGSNTTENHPIFANYIKEAVLKKGAKLIVVDPRKIDLVDYADIWLRPKPGTDIAWINGLLHIIIKENLHAAEYIKERTEGFEELKACVEKYTPEYVSEITGIKASDLVNTAITYGKAKPASIMYAMVITQHINGTDNVKSLANLAMLCGNISVEGGGVNPLRGQNNVQGACDLGALPNVFTGYQPVTNDEVRQKFEMAWGVDNLQGKVGLTVTEMFNAAEEGKVKAMYIMGENPLLSDPDLNHIEHCIKSLDFLVVQDIFLTETAKYADVVLPAVSFAEKDGTFTNSERKVQRIRKAIKPRGEAKEGYRIICELSNKLGFRMDYSSPRNIMEEIRKVTPSYAGITYERIEEEGIQWPCPDEGHPGTPILHVGQFARGKGQFTAIEYQEPAELPDDEYPFLLATGRVFAHYHAGTMTSKGKGLNMLYPELLVEINPDDAVSLGIASGDSVHITSRRGDIKVKAQVSERPDRGVVFLPFHLKESPANILTINAIDPIAKIPQYKVCAVRIEGIKQ
jgi:formate dehydrogenase alpha subunit